MAYHRAYGRNKTIVIVTLYVFTMVGIPTTYIYNG